MNRRTSISGRYTAAKSASVGAACAASAKRRIMPGWQSRTSSRRLSMIFARASSDPAAMYAPVIQ
jgi:hypothetical protein